MSPGISSSSGSSASANLSTAVAPITIIEDGAFSNAQVSPLPSPRVSTGPHIPGTADLSLPILPSPQESLSDSEESPLLSDFEETTTGRVSLSLDRINPPPRAGGHCKLFALAFADLYYAQQFGIDPIPLLARKNPAVESVRHISKRHNSVQGEVLQKEDLVEIAKEIGYKCEEFNCATETEFKEIICKSLKEGKLPMIVFPVLSNGRPNIGEKNPSEKCEHGALITELDSERSEVTLAHWRRTYVEIPVSDLYESMQNLKETRTRESYFHTQGSRLRDSNSRENYKYRDVTGEEDKYSKENLLQSIAPKPNTGFKNCLFVLTPDSSSPRWKEAIRTRGTQSLRPSSTRSWLESQCYKLYQSEETKETRGIVASWLDELSDCDQYPEFVKKAELLRRQLLFLDGHMGSSSDEIKGNFGKMIDELIQPIFDDPTQPSKESALFQTWFLERGNTESEYQNFLLGNFDSDTDF